MEHFNDGPESILDLILVTASLLVVLYAFYQAIRCTMWPGERSPDHIKRRILEQDSENQP